MPTSLNSLKIVAGSANNYVLPKDLHAEPSQKRIRELGVNYVPFLNFNNDVLNVCQAAVNTSSTTSAIIRQKVHMTVGEGFMLAPQRTMLQSIQAVVSENEAEAINAFLEKINPEGENAQDLLRKIAFDFWSFGNCFVEVQRTRLQGNMIYSCRVLPIYICRPKTMKEGETSVRYVGISEDFQDGSDYVSDYELPVFPNFERIDSVERSVIHLKQHYPNFFYWGFPDWFASKMWAELEYRIPRFNVAKMENGYVPSAIISLFGDETPEDQKRLIEKFKDTFTGTGNNSKMFVQVLSDKEQAAQVQTLENRNEGEFLELMQLAKAQIVSAHQWTIGLAGEAIPGKLGTNQQIRDEYELVNSNVIAPTQKQILDTWLNPLLKMAGFKSCVQVVSSKPVNFSGAIDIKQVLTIDEQRELLGYSAMQQPTAPEPIVNPETEEDAN